MGKVRTIIDVKNMKKAGEFLEKSIGKKYRIFSSSSSLPKHIFSINSGVIRDVGILNEVIFVNLEGQTNIERFTSSRMKEVIIDDNMIHFIFLDGSYFKVFITEEKYYAHKHWKLFE